MEHALGEPRLDDAARHVAGTGDRVIGVTPDPEAVEKSLHRVGRIWRVSDEDHRPAADAKPRKRIGGLREGGDAIMHHAPNVAEQNVIVACER